MSDVGPVSDARKGQQNHVCTVIDGGISQVVENKRSFVFDFNMSVSYQPMNRFSEDLCLRYFNLTKHFFLR